MKKSIIAFCAAASFVVLPTVSHAAQTANEGHFERGVSVQYVMPPFEFKFMQNSEQTVVVKKWFVNQQKANKPSTVEKETEGVKEQPVVERAEVVKEATPEQPTTSKEQASPVVEKEQVVKQPTAEQPESNEDSVENPVQQASESKPAQENLSDVDKLETAVVQLTNNERAKAGLAPLEMDAALMAAAREKSQDMKVNHYFSHTSPTFGSPFDRLKALGISYQAAGENIAKGQKTAEEVVTAWMKSEGHRANLLDGKFTHIGVGFVKEGSIWTQQFIKK